MNNQLISKLKSEYSQVKLMVSFIGSLIQSRRPIYCIYKLKLKLDGPIKCVKLECEFKVAVQDLKISGDLEVLFKDGQKENFIPKSRFEVESTDNSKLVYSMKAYIDPKTGQLQDLVHIKDKSSSIEVGADSLQTKLNLNTTFKSEQQKKAQHPKAQDLDQPLKYRSQSVPCSISHQSKSAAA